LIRSIFVRIKFDELITNAWIVIPPIISSYLIWCLLILFYFISFIYYISLIPFPFYCGNSINGFSIDNSNIGFILLILVLFPLIYWISVFESKTINLSLFLFLLFIILLFIILFKSLLWLFFIYEYLIIYLFILLFIFLPSFYRIRNAFFFFIFPLFGTISFIFSLIIIYFIIFIISLIINNHFKELIRTSAIIETIDIE